MSQFRVIHVRKNKTSTDEDSPHFENPSESHLTVEVRATTPEGATKKAEQFWADRPEWGNDAAAWSVLSVEDLDADPE